MFKGSNHTKSADRFSGDLYHKDVYMPKILLNKAIEMFTQFKRNTELSSHIKESKDCDRCHTYNLELIEKAIRDVNPAQASIFEIGTDWSLNDNPNTNIRKFAVRMPYNTEEDVVVVYNANGSVRTAWLNWKNDNHYTLDKSKYVKK